MVLSPVSISLISSGSRPRYRPIICFTDLRRTMATARRLSVICPALSRSSRALNHRSTRSNRDVPSVAALVIELIVPIPLALERQDTSRALGVEEPTTARYQRRLLITTSVNALVRCKAYAHISEAEMERASKILLPWIFLVLPFTGIQSC